jgi:HD-like signal output (HDOD) protein
MPEARQGGVDVVAAIEALPPLPAVALRVMQVAQDPKASASDLALVVSADPGLSSRILRVVNSAAYRRMREVTSVQQALVTLGFVQARNLALSGAIAGAYAPDALNALFRIETFWRHSLAVAFKAAELAGQGRRVDVPSAFTAGIVHNMGRLALFYRDPALVDQAVARAMAEGRRLEEVEAELGFDHAAAGELLARKWKLPEAVCEAIGRHHEPLDTNQTLAGCVAMADRYVVEHGLLPGYVLPPEPGTVRVPAPEFALLMKQVDALMELVTGQPVGVRAA